MGTVQSDRDIVFPDVSVIRPTEYAGPYWRKEHLKSLFPEDAEGLDEYFESLERMTALAILSRDDEISPRYGRLKRLFSMKWLSEPLRRYQDWTTEQMMNASYLSNKFKEFFGISPIYLHRELLVESAKGLLNTTSLSIGEITENLGFSDIAVFTRFFTEKAGATPSKYRSTRRRSPLEHHPHTKVSQLSEQP